jgi:hypothetical protein
VLAVQNMEASGTVARGQEIEFSALEGSLSMMSKGPPYIDLLVTRADKVQCSFE